MPPSQTSRPRLRRGKSSTKATSISEIATSGNASRTVGIDGGSITSSGGEGERRAGDEGGGGGPSSSGGFIDNHPSTPPSKPITISESMGPPNNQTPFSQSYIQQAGYQQQQFHSQIQSASSDHMTQRPQGPGYMAYPGSYPPQPMLGGIPPPQVFWSHAGHLPPPPPPPPQQQQQQQHQHSSHHTTSSTYHAPALRPDSKVAQPTVALNPHKRGGTELTVDGGKDKKGKGWEGEDSSVDTHQRTRQSHHHPSNQRSHPYHQCNSPNPQPYQFHPPSQYYILQQPYYYDHNGALQPIQTPTSTPVDSGYWSGGSPQGYPSNPRMMMAPPVGYNREELIQGTMAPEVLIPRPPFTMSNQPVQFSRSAWDGSGSTTSIGDGTSTSVEGTTPITDDYDINVENKDGQVKEEEESEVLADQEFDSILDNNMEEVPIVKGKKPILTGLSHISRPPNAWILYRSDKLRSIAAGERIPSDVRAQAVEESGGDTDVSTEPGANEGESSAAPRTIEDGGTKKRKKKKPAAATVAFHAALEADAAKVSREGGKGMPQADISKLISLMWKSESKTVKAQYEKLATAKKAEHQARYPDYKYQPMKKEDKERLKLEKEQEREAVRKEKAEQAKTKPRRSRAKPKLSDVLSHHPFHSSQVRNSGSDYNAPPQSSFSLSYPPGRDIPRVHNTSALPGWLSPRAKKTSRRGGTTPSPRRRDEQLEMQALDGPQVYWGAPPELPTSGPAQISQISFLPLEQRQHPQFRQIHGLDELPIPAAPPPAEMGTDGWATEWQDPQWRQTQREQEEQSHVEQGIHLHQEGTSGQSLPLPELCYAVDFDPNMAVPYIFEPMALYPNSHATDLIPDLERQHAEHADTTSNGEMSYGPLGGVSASELTEMWCLLEEEDGNKGHQLQAGSAEMVPEWTGNVDSALSLWGDLGVSFDGEGTRPIELSSSNAKEIASKWALESSHRHQQEAEGNTLVDSDGHMPPILSYERPGYLTIQVPISTLGTNFDMPGGGMALHGQNALLSSVTPMTPEGPTFAMGLHQSIRQTIDGAMADGNILDDRNSVGDPMPITPSFGSFNDMGLRFASSSAYPPLQVDGDDFTDPGWMRNASGTTVGRSRQGSAMFGLSDTFGAEKPLTVGEVQSWPAFIDKDIAERGPFITEGDVKPLALTTSHLPVGSGGGGRGRRSRTVATSHK